MTKPQTLHAKDPQGRIITFDDYVSEGDTVSVFEFPEDEEGFAGEFIVVHTFDDGWTLRELTEEERKEK
jgi:hypothetical protein